MRKITVTGQELAGELGLSRVWISRLANQGVFHRGSDNRFDLAASVQAYIRYRLKRTGASDAAKLLKARLNKLKADCRYAQLLFRKDSDRLVCAGAAELHYSTMRETTFSELPKLTDIAQR